MRSELVQAALTELERALEANPELLATDGKRTLNVKVAVTRIDGGHRVAGSCIANGKKHFSFGTIVTPDPEEL